jgi:hypothetical protein
MIHTPVRSCKPALEELESRYQPTTVNGAQLNALASQIFNHVAFQAVVVQQTQMDISAAIANQNGGTPDHQAALNQQVANDLLFQFASQYFLEVGLNNYLSQANVLNNQGLLDAQDKANFASNSSVLSPQITVLNFAQMININVAIANHVNSIPAPNTAVDVFAIVKASFPPAGA